jgi:hypothetical protein
MNEISVLRENSGSDQLDDSMLLQMLNSARKSSIEVSNIMGKHPIDPINKQKSDLINSCEPMHDTSFVAEIGGNVDGFCVNSAHTTAIGDPKFMGNMSIGKNIDRLHPNSIPQPTGKLPIVSSDTQVNHNLVSPTPNLGGSTSTIDKTPPTLNYAPTIPPPMPIPPTNNSMKISSNFEPPPRVPLQADNAASKLGSAKPPTVPSGFAGATQPPRSYAAALNCKPAITQAERSYRKSFAHVLSAPEDSRYRSLVSKEPYIHHGEPAVFFDESDELFLAEAYRFTLIGKFMHRKPSMNKVRENFMRFGFTGNYEIGLIDEAHIIIHLAHEDDYSRLFLKPTWYIDGCPMRVFKWTPNFSPQYEAPIAPIWVSFPLLPIHFRDKSALFAIAKAIGLPLRIDEATSDLRRPSEARVCVEIDLECRLPDRVWIEREKWGGYWQPVVYDKVPYFCFRCRHFGHMDDKCSSNSHPPPPSMPPLATDQPVKPLPVLAKDKGKGKEAVTAPRQRWTPVKRTQKIQEGTCSHSTSENTTSIPPTIPVTTVIAAQTATTSFATPVLRTIDPQITLSVPPNPSTVAPTRIGHYDQPNPTPDAQPIAQPSHPVTGNFIYFDPILENMMERPQNSVGLEVPGSPTRCQQNLEASLSTQSDSESFSHIEVHQQGSFRRSSSEDLVAMADRMEDDGFVPVGRTRTSKVTSISVPRMATRSRSQDTSSSVSR